MTSKFLLKRQPCSSIVSNGRNDLQERWLHWCVSHIKNSYIDSCQGIPGQIKYKSIELNYLMDSLCKCIVNYFERFK